MRQETGDRPLARFGKAPVAAQCATEPEAAALQAGLPERERRVDVGSL